MHYLFHAAFPDCSIGIGTSSCECTQHYVFFIPDSTVLIILPLFGYVSISLSQDSFGCK